MCLLSSQRNARERRAAQLLYVLGDPGCFAEVYMIGDIPNSQQASRALLAKSLYTNRSPRGAGVAKSLAETKQVA